MISKAGAVDRFEHRRVAASGSRLAVGGDTQTAGKRRGQGRKECRVQVGGDEGIEADAGRLHHARGSGVDQFLIPFTSGNSSPTSTVISSCITIRMRCALDLGRDDRQTLARARLRELEGKALNAHDTSARHH